MTIVSIPILKLFCPGPVKNYTFYNSMLGVMSLNSSCRGQKTVQHTQLKHHDSETSSVMQATCTSPWIKGTRSLHKQLLVCTSTSSQPTRPILHPEKWNCVLTACILNGKASNTWMYWTHGMKNIHPGRTLNWRAPGSRSCPDHVLICPS